MKYTIHHSKTPNRRIGIITLNEADSLHDTASLKDVIHELTDQDIYVLVLDMQAVSHLKSAYLGTIIHTLKFLRDMDGDLVLANVQPGVISLLELVHLLSHVSRYESVEAAIAGLIE